jgi:hypothetical protein
LLTLLLTTLFAWLTISLPGAGLLRLLPARLRTGLSILATVALLPLEVITKLLQLGNRPGGVVSGAFRSALSGFLSG